LRSRTSIRSCGGVVVSDEVQVAVNVEAILKEDLERTGAIEYYETGAEASQPELA